MIEKINGLGKSFLPFNSDINQKNLVLKTVTDEFKKTSSDVKDNFSFKITNSGLSGVQILNGKSKMEGICYGQKYEIYRKGLHGNIEINGKIGDKSLKINCKRKNIFSSTRNVEGFVGDKKIQLKETDILGAKKLRGTFGNEEIKLTLQHTRHNDLITGKGVNMSLMYYAESNRTPKYVGDYNLDTEFLPVLAALYRYM